MDFKAQGVKWKIMSILGVGLDASWMESFLSFRGGGDLSSLVFHIQSIFRLPLYRSALCLPVVLVQDALVNYLNEVMLILLPICRKN